MAIEIPVPDESFAEINVPLSGIQEEVSGELRGRLYLDIYLDDSPVKVGIKIMEQQGLLSQYLLDDFSHGDIYCLRKRESENKALRGTIGFTKEYGLFYLTNEELE
jgi:hypothetical protein